MNIDNVNSNKLNEDLALFHPSFKDSFNQYKTVISKLSKFGKNTLIYNLIFFLVPFAISYNINSSFFTFSIFASSYFIFNLALLSRYVFLFSKKTYYKTMIQFALSGSRMKSLQPVIQTLSTDNELTHEYESFMNNINKGVANDDDISFYISILDIYLKNQEISGNSNKSFSSVQVRHVNSSKRNVKTIDFFKS
jgi:hypothetical protein